MTPRRRRAAAGAGALTLALALGATGATAAGRPYGAGAATSRSRAARGIGHVLLISVDGMHQSDLNWYVAHHPASALARLATGGAQYTNAATQFPSDSFPGLVGQVTGGDPGTTGIWYDVTYNRTLLAPGTTDCAGATPGTTVAYDESIDKDPTSLDAGQKLPGLPDSILNLTANARSLINPAGLPVDPTTCKPVYPNQYLRVNTVFEVARRHGLGTAWSDKHAAYDIVSGPSGTGVQDFFTPEINSDASDARVPSADWTTDNADTRQYDAYKVAAVLNEIDGRDHSGTHRANVPAVFGLNFQSVSTAEKLPTSEGEPGGYLADGLTPGPVLSGALDFVDAELGAVLNRLHSRGLDRDTAVIVSAKHGQSPTQGSALTRIADGPILDSLNAAWNATGATGTLVSGSSDDDAMLLWLSDRSRRAEAFARSFLLDYNGNGTGTDGKAKATDIAGSPRAYTAAGLSTIYTGAAAARLGKASAADPRHPDLIGVVRHGVVYTGKTGKIAEHGGDDAQDRHVPLIVFAPGMHPGTVGAPVRTTQIAPTILRLLGLDPRELQAVRIEGTKVLPQS
jgi:Type I phosphodiesterase / nucleotide pyrophosphatase